MSTFMLRPEVRSYPTFADFAAAEKLTASDLIVTNEFIYEPFMKPAGVPCKTLFQEKYGAGEPNDAMIDAIRKDIPEGVDRIIAVGGGTVIDIAKVLTFDGDWETEDLFMSRVVPNKVRKLIVVPTTCGTGSEVTNVTVCALTKMNTKKGLALDLMYADAAVLIPEMVATLPYKFFATSSIDALIHATESFLSPKANAHTRIFSERAIAMIVAGYKHIEANGADSWKDKAADFLTASNFAGIAFGNAGCAAVHALSYPLGGKYHIPHGESNQLMFAGVMRKYAEKKPVGALNDLEAVYAAALGVPADKALDELYRLLDVVYLRKPLREYGITREEFPEFTKSVIEGQQRLLNNNYVELSYEDMIDIYEKCF